MTSVFVSAETGIPQTEEHFQGQADYIQSWMKMLKEDPNVLFRAAAAANRASEEILKYERVREQVGENNMSEQVNFGREVYTPKVGDKIEFAPHEGGIRLNGSVVSVTEETVVLKAGRREIPVFKSKGVFSEQKVVEAEKNIASQDIDLACV